jgi:hypothetical protein
MAVNLAPIGNDAPYVDSSGNPLSGGKIYFYTANSSTPQDTYTTSVGDVANANPVVLDSAGYPSNGSSVVEIWLTAGVSYKAVLKNAAGTTLWTRDYINGINDTTVTIDQWVSGPAPTYVSGTQFTLVGDQTSTFMVGRRLKTTNSGGTIYSTISASSYAALTTITVVNDSGTLDSGLSAVSYGLLSATNVSIPKYAGNFSSITSPAGSGTQTFLGNGRIDTQTSTGGIGNTAATTDDTIFTYTLPANSMSANGNTARVTFGGSTAANGNNKTVKIWFGGIVVLSTGVITANNAEFSGWVEITRLSATKIQAHGMFVSSNGTTSINALADVTLNQTVSDLTTNTSIIKFTGASPTTGAANDVIGYSMFTHFSN